MTYWIAEIGSNHNGDVRRALALVDAAAEAGFNAVKGQAFSVERVFVPEALEHVPGLRERKQHELPEGAWAEVAAHAKTRGLDFGLTVFEPMQVLDWWHRVNFLKVASYELTSVRLLQELAARARGRVFVSTGMATLEEVAAAFAVLRAGRAAVTLLHCVSAYPARLDEANLAAIGLLRDRVCATVGLSDHTANPAVVLRAVHAWCAEVVELHVDLADGAGAETKHGHCWRMDDARRLVEIAGVGVAADGERVKAPKPREVEERLWRADPLDGRRPTLAQRAKWAR